MAVASALPRSPAILLLQGEAGVGKTRLLSEAMALADPRRPILTGASQSLSEPFSLGPVIDALRDVRGLLPEGGELPRITGVLRPFFPQLSDDLPPAPEGIGDPGAERHRVFRALTELVAAVGPVTVVLEDLHWADANTCDFTAFLSSNLPEQVTLVLTYRSDEVVRSPFMKALAQIDRTADLRLDLKPLDAPGVGQLICSILGADHVSNEFARFVVEKTAGVPFAVEELIKLLQERKDLIARDARWTRRTLAHIEVPGAIRDQVIERLGHLSYAGRAVTHAAAAFGRAIAPSALAVIAGLSSRDASDGLGEALDAVLLKESADGRCDFRHSLARQAVYEAIPLPERTALHRRAALHLEDAADDAISSQIAHHYRMAGDVAGWVTHAEAAADLAVELHDDARALDYLRDAVASSEVDSSTRTRLAIKYADAALHCLAHDQAVVVIDELLSGRVVDPRDRAELTYKLGLLLMQAGRTAEGATRIADAVPGLETVRPELAVRALAGLAVPDVAGSHVGLHRDWLERALAGAERCEDPAIRAAIASDAAVALLCLGDGRWRESASRLSLQAEGKVGREAVRGCRNLVNISTYLGHYEEAKVLLEQGTARSKALEYARFVKMFGAAALRIDWLTGRWEGLEQRARDLTGERIAYSFVDAKLVLGALLLSRGDQDNALDLLQAATDEAHETDDVPAVADAAGMLVRALMAAGRHECACRCAVRALDVLSAKGIWTWSGILVSEAARAFSDLDLVDDLTALASQSDEGLKGADAPAAHLARQECRALLARRADDSATEAASLDLAVEGWAGLPNPYRAAAAAELRGQSSRTEEPEDARAALVRALEIYEGLGATFDAARVRLALRREGVAIPHPWRGGRRGYGPELSPRERETAGLAAEGYTNKEIAQALFLSPRTVAHHLSAAMQKLGVGSRRELRAVAPPGDK